VRAPRQPRIAAGRGGAATIRLSTATLLGAVQLALVAMAAVVAFRTLGTNLAAKITELATTITGQ